MIKLVNYGLTHLFTKMDLFSLPLFFIHSLFCSAIILLSFIYQSIHKMISILFNEKIWISCNETCQLAKINAKRRRKRKENRRKIQWFIYFRHSKHNFHSNKVIAYFIDGNIYLIYVKMLQKVYSFHTQQIKTFPVQMFANIHITCDTNFIFYLSTTMKNGELSLLSFDLKH